MSINDYKLKLNDIFLPTEEETKMFIKKFTLIHSWYKHLSDERETEFVFYINQVGQWDYELKNNSFKLNLPFEVINIGILSLSKFIYGSFAIQNEFYDEKSKLSYAEIHQNEINDLCNHLILILNKIKNLN